MNTSYMDNIDPIDFESMFKEFSPQTQDYKFILKLTNLENLFYDVAEKYGDNVVILNHINYSDPNYSDVLANTIFSRSSELDFVPRCECGNLEGVVFEGMICQQCKTEVTDDMEIVSGKLLHKAWLKCPNEIKGGFLHPTIYKLLTSDWLKYKPTSAVNRGETNNYLDLIINPKLECDVPEMLPLLEMGRGFSFLYENFDMIISFFANTFPKTAKKTKLKIPILYVIALNKNNLFTRYLPILSSTLHAVISSGDEHRKNYVNKNCGYVMAAASNLSYLEFAIRKKPQEIYEYQTTISYRDYIKYQDDVTITQLSKKRSLPRMHLFAARLNFTCRGVITPHTKAHQMDELTLPWSMIVNLMKMHILGKLLKKYTLDEALRIHFNALENYSDEINDIIEALIEECPFKGLPCLFNRNPTIHNGSIQLLFITRFKKDPKDNTINTSTLLASAFNMDYDGDEMNIFVFTEMEAVRYFINLHPSRIILGRNSPKLRSTISIPKPLLVTLNSFLEMI